MLNVEQIAELYIFTVSSYFCKMGFGWVLSGTWWLWFGMVFVVVPQRHVFHGPSEVQTALKEVFCLFFCFVKSWVFPFIPVCSVSMLVISLSAEILGCRDVAVDSAFILVHADHIRNQSPGSES